ncbi:hypothetical protein FI667_g3595, partial [Globisporangium splendens]
MPSKADAMESRFEVLEEETHYPETHPKAAKSAEDEQEEIEEEEETLEAKLGKLLLNEDDEKSVKNASKAKELGNDNRAACLIRLNRPEEAIDDCNQSIELSPTYVKALIRRAEAYEKVDKLEEALKDYEAVLAIDPTIRPAIQAQARLKKSVEERQEKMKAEMLEKLKGFGNTILGKFGLSTDNFQMVQDPNTGSYSVNFNQNPQQRK